MRAMKAIVMSTLLGLGAAAVVAQPASGPGPGPGVGLRAASGPGMGGGPHAMGRWGGDHTPGWALMSAKERDEHRARMQSMSNHEECKAYHQQHHEQMAARAKERGATKPLAQPRHDACAGLRKP